MAADSGTADQAASAPGGRLLPRHDQTFPVLSAAEIERIRRFGEVRRYADGARLFETGQPGPGMFVVLSGHVAVSQRDGLGHVTPVAEQGPGQFLAEIGQLSGRVALVDGIAEGEVECLLIPPERLRGLLVAEADLGERIMRALILRRVNLIQGGVGGPVLIGSVNASDAVRLMGFLTRNGWPHHLLDPATDPIEGDLSFAISKRRRTEGGFPGSDRILKALANGAARKRVGLSVEGKMPVREGALLYAGADVVGEVTSGGFAPTVNAPIAMAFIAAAHSAPGTHFEAEVRGKRVPVAVTTLPFVPHHYHRKGAAQ